jgi:hypothetical protein
MGGAGARGPPRSALNRGSGRWSRRPGLGHIALATAGAAGPLRRYFQTPDADAEVDQIGLNRHRPPMLASEIPEPLSELHAWADHLLPAGFRGGLAASGPSPESWTCSDHRCRPAPRSPAARAGR